MAFAREVCKKEITRGADFQLVLTHHHSLFDYSPPLISSCAPQYTWLASAGPQYTLRGLAYHHRQSKQLTSQMLFLRPFLQCPCYYSTQRRHIEF